MHVMQITHFRRFFFPIEKEGFSHLIPLKKTETWGFVVVCISVLGEYSPGDKHLNDPLLRPDI